MAPIARYFSSIEAHLARLRLLAAGIPSWLEGEYLAGFVGWTGGPGEVRLWVHPKDHEEARAALFPGEVASTSDEDFDAALHRERRFRWWGWFLLLAMGVPSMSTWF